MADHGEKATLATAWDSRRGGRGQYYTRERNKEKRIELDTSVIFGFKTGSSFKLGTWTGRLN